MKNITNNLKGKSEAILNAYISEMTNEEIFFFGYLSTVSYIDSNDMQKFLLSDFRYRAFNSGLI